MNKLAFFALAPLLTGCGGVSGIWMLTVPYQDGGSTCESTIEENFVDGYVPGDDVPTDNSDWSTEETHSGADTLFFAQIETTKDGAGVLLLGNAAYPGDFDKGVWTFEWNDESSDVIDTTHTSGYSFSATERTVNTGRLTLTLDGLFGAAASGEGEFTSESETVDSYTESDTWSDAVVDAIGDTGQIPSSAYLVFDDPNDNQRPQNNDYDVEDCDGDCTLTLRDACSGSSVFTAQHTDYRDEDAYGYLQASGNGSL